MPSLFDSLALRSVVVRNRIGMSPMCMYASRDGHAQDFHFTHLTARALGGCGLIICEATAVEARGRISPSDAGLWLDSHIEPLARINRAIRGFGAVPGVQLAHAGRKAATGEPYMPMRPRRTLRDDERGWLPAAPSPVAFRPDDRTPQELSLPEIRQVQSSFVDAASRAVRAGFELIEIHSAHGYLCHQFLSPISNHRRDEYGGSFDGRTRFLLETVRGVRAAIPDSLPLAVRLSCTDWVEGAWDLEQSVELAGRLKAEGVDLVDCSSGGSVVDARIPVSPGYQVPFAERIRHQAGVRTAAVGDITEASHANAIIVAEQADVVLLGRALLRNPNWAIDAARALGTRKQALPLAPSYEWVL